MAGLGLALRRASWVVAAGAASAGGESGAMSQVVSRGGVGPRFPNRNREGERGSGDTLECWDSRGRQSDSEIEHVAGGVLGRGPG